MLVEYKLKESAKNKTKELSDLCHKGDKKETEESLKQITHKINDLFDGKTSFQISMKDNKTQENKTVTFYPEDFEKKVD